MKKRLSEGLRHLGFVVMLVLCLVVSGEAYGYAQESGGEPLPLLRFGTTARIWGMGNAGVAIAEGVEGLYYNPAGLSAIHQPELSISHSALHMDTDLYFLAAGLPLARNTGIGAGLLLLSSPGIQGADADSPTDYFDYLQAVAYAGFGLETGKRLKAGLTAKGLFGELAEATCRGFALDGGLRYQVNPLLTVGVLARDLVGELSWSTGLKERLPSQCIGGASLSLLQGKVLLSAETDMAFKKWGLGAEYSIGDHVKLRGGYAKQSLTAGAGLGLGNVYLDYSWVGHELGGTHRLSFAVRF